MATKRINGINKDIDSIIINIEILISSPDTELKSENLKNIYDTLVRLELYGWIAMLHGNGFFDKSNNLRRRSEEISSKFKKIYAQIGASQTEEELRFTPLSALITRRILSLHSTKVTTNSNKLILVIDSLSPGGAERQFVNMLNLLSESTVNITAYGLVLNCNHKERSDFYLNKLNRKAKDNLIIGSDILYDHDVNELLDFIPSKHRSDNIKKITKAIRSTNSSLVIGFLEESAITSAIAAKLCGIRAIMRFGSLPNLIGRNHSKNSLFNAAVRSCILSELNNEDVIWASNSRKCLNSYIINYARSHNVRWRLLYNVLTRDKPKECTTKPEYGSIRSDTKIIVSIMRLSEEKRPGFFLDLCCGFSNRNDCQFLLIGDGPLSYTVEAFINDHSPKNLIWIKNTNSVYHYLEKSHIYVVTSRVEGSPNAALEASSINVPVLAGRVGGISDTYKHMENAYFVKDHNSSSSYIESLETIIDDLRLLNKLSRNAHALVKNRHSGESTVNNILISMDLN